MHLYCYNVLVSLQIIVSKMPEPLESLSVLPLMCVESVFVFVPLPICA